MWPGVKREQGQAFARWESPLGAASLDVVTGRPSAGDLMTARHADAERACEYVIAKVQAAAGRLFHQGARVPPLATRSPSPAVRFIAERRIHRVSTAVARALLAWADGSPVELFTDVPAAATVLALQAEGRRCVSLLPEGAETHPHPDVLAFAVHDLCHLDKFIDPEHYGGQVGFFACLHRAVQNPAWNGFENKFDAAFIHDWHHVAADMNGSAVFLFAALKMKLKMAARRCVAAAHGARPNEGGPLTPSEARAYGEFFEELLDMLILHGDIADAARRTSAKRDDPLAARKLLRHFETMGADVLQGRWAHPAPLPPEAGRAPAPNALSEAGRAPAPNALSEGGRAPRPECAIEGGASAHTECVIRGGASARAECATRRGAKVHAECATRGGPKARAEWMAGLRHRDR